MDDVVINKLPRGSVRGLNDYVARRFLGVRGISKKTLHEHINLSLIFIWEYQQTHDCSHVPEAADLPEALRGK